MFGPAHRVFLNGGALPEADCFETPLGLVYLDKELMEKILGDYSWININDHAHSEEHCLEVQLPFLQETLDEFKLIPGQIKENITTTGLDLSNIQPGNVFFVGDNVTLEATGLCDPCHKMDVIEDGLQAALDGKRGILSIVLNGGTFNVGDSIRVEP